MTEQRNPDTRAQVPIERQAVLGRLVRAATAGGGRAMLVGDPGIGKTHLLRAVVRTATAVRVVLTARADQHDDRRCAVLADLVSKTPEEAFPALAPVHRETLETLVADPAAAEPTAVVSALTQLLAHLAKPGTTIVIDDWQWADVVSRRVLERVMSRSSTVAVTALLVARRSDGSGDDFAVKPLFTAADVVPVPPLSRTSVRSVLESVSVGHLTPSAMDDVADASAGNPLWAIELATARTEGDPRALAPRTVTEVMRQRLGSLPEQVRTAVAVASAARGGLRSGDASAFCDDGDAAVHEGVRRGVLRVTDDHVHVASPLLGAAALELLPPAARRAVHATLADLPLPPTARLLHRDDAAPVGADEGLAVQLIEAARAARRSGDTAGALLLARRAVARTAEEHGDRHERVVETAELAFAAGDMTLTLEVLDRFDVERLSLPLFDRAVAVLADSLDRVGGQPLVTRRMEALQQVLGARGARWMVAEVHLLSLSRARLASVRDELASLAQQLSPTETPRTLGKALGWISYFDLDAGQGIDDDLLGRLRGLEHRLTSLPLEETTDAIEALWPYQTDDLSRSRAGLTAYIRSAKVAGEHYAVAQGLAHASVVEVLAGRTDIADRFLIDCEAQVGRASSVPPSVFRARALRALVADDREAIAAVTGGWLSPAAEYRGGLLRAAVAGLDAAASERWEDAIVELDRARSLAEARGIVEPGRRMWLDVELGRALVHTGDLLRASSIASALTAIGLRSRRAHVQGQGTRLRALLAWSNGDHAHARALSDQALVDLERGGFLPEVVRARIERAAMAGDADDRAAALLALERVRPAADRVRDPRLDRRLTRAVDELQQADLRGVLTTSEDRVAGLAAVGWSNREIADELVVSVRTVETHLAAVYRKLGLRSRTQLALAFRNGQASQGR